MSSEDQVEGVADLGGVVSSSASSSASINAGDVEEGGLGSLPSHQRTNSGLLQPREEAKTMSVSFEGAGLDGLKQVQESSKLGGADLQWQRLHYTINITDKKSGTTQKRVLLNHVSGVVRKGQLLAIMGPSGAGKTTLLNTLSGRGGKPNSGRILVDGQPVNKDTMSLFGYVRQEDTHFSYMTPREILTISARLRLPSSISHEAKMQKVELIIKELGLTKCADTQVGTDMIKGISGGEKKRLSVGVELITDPNIIFLDEPTSGLDSHMALSLFEKLSELKTEIGRPIVSTIHQPSTKLFNSFDLLLLLSEGNTVYFGPAKDAVDYFNNIGLHCPLYSNPCEFFLDVCSLHEGRQVLANTSVQEGVDPSLEYIISSWKQQETVLARTESVFNSKLLEDEFQDADNLDDGAPPAQQNRKSRKRSPKRYATSVWNQTMVLLWRSMLGFFRAKEMFFGQLGEVVIMGLLVGLVFLQVDNTQGGNTARQGAIFFMAMQMTFGPVMAQFSTFGNERNVIGHERDGKWYQMIPYFLGKSIAELPQAIVLPFVYNLVSYFMVGLTVEASNFFAFCGVLILLYMAGSSLGLLVSAITPNFQLANVVGSVILIFVILLSGYFLPDSDVPVFLRWIREVSFLRYGFDLLMHIEYNSISTFRCTPNELTASGECPITTGKQALEAAGFADIDVGLSIGMLIVLTMAYRLLTYFAIRFYRPKM